MIKPPPPGTSLVLDTNVLTHWRTRRPNVLRAINDYQEEFKVPPALTSFTVFEVLCGFEKEAARSRVLLDSNRRAREELEWLVEGCSVLPFDQGAATIAAYVFERIGKRKSNEKWADVLIASTAIAHRYGLVSQNKKDFELIANHLPAGQTLYLTNWQP